MTLACEQRTNEARLSIVDNGRGFDLANSSPERMGMSIMRERAAAIQADLDLSSETGGGTQLLLLWQASASNEGGEAQ